jgi:hypothetical protein
MKIKVYAKLSIDERSIKKILPGAVVCAPVARDDLPKDVDQGFNVIAIVDGKFDQSMSVSPTEIMDALRCGVRVYGSSSIGALRAAETQAYGMIGVGEIYEYIRSKPFFRDDLLGQVFVDFDQSFKSYTYVDFFFATENLVKKGLINRKDAQKLCRIYADLHYMDRNSSALLSILSRKKSASQTLIQAAKRIFNSGYSQKKVDAIRLMQTVRGDLTSVKRINDKLVRNQKDSKDPFKFYPEGLLEFLKAD